MSLAPQYSPIINYTPIPKKVSLVKNKTPKNYTPVPLNKPTSGSVLGASTGPTSGGYSTPYTNPQPASTSLPGTLSSDEGAYDDMQKAEEERTGAEIESANADYDRTMALLSQQETSLGTQRQQSLDELAAAQQGYESKLGTARQGYEQKTQRNILSALGLAKDVERKNRNVLRGLGILNSSAAGELLQRPYEEYSKQRADMVMDLQTRQKELDDALLQQQQDYKLKVASLENNYADLVGQIQIDKRFSTRDKAAAIRQAQASLTNRLAQIDLENQNWRNAVSQYNAQLQQEWASVGYDPGRMTFDPSTIQNTLTSVAKQPEARTFSTYEDPKRKATMLSAY